MKKQLKLLFILISLIPLSFNTTLAQEDDATPVNLLGAEIEAEDFAFTTAVDEVYSWNIVGDTLMAGMSNELAIQASPGDSVNNFGNSGYQTTAPSSSYLVNFEEAGTYYFYFRVNSLASQDANSFHVGISNGTDTTNFSRVEFDGDIDTWQWGNTLKGGDTVFYEVTTPGTHEIIFWAREIGIVIDKFMISGNEDLPENISSINLLGAEIEAEDFSYKTEVDEVYSWNVVGDTLMAGMSNELAIQASPGDSVNNFGNDGYQSTAPSTSYLVNFEEAGTYYFFARVNTMASGDKNSFHLGISNGTDTTNFTRVELNQDIDTWQWGNTLKGGDTVVYEVTKPGMHEVIFWAREIGIVIDKFMISGIKTNPRNIPSINLSGNEIEAENYTYTTKVDEIYSWDIVGDTLIAGMSNELAIQASPGDSVNNFGNDGYQSTAPSTSYLVNFEEAGTYYFFARVNTIASGDKNSFHLGISDGSDTTNFTRVELNQDIDTWQWGNTLKGGDTIVYKVTKPGMHEIIFWAREIGIVIDKFMISAEKDIPVDFISIDLSGVEIEAEDFAYTTEIDEIYSWDIVDETLITGMSNELAIQASPGDSVNNFGNDGYQSTAPSASYVVNFEEAGTYYFFARANSLASGDKNSFHLGISNGTDTTNFTRLEFAEDIDIWQWGNTLKGGDTVFYEVTAPGMHEIVFWAREIGIVIDKFIISGKKDLLNNLEKSDVTFTVKKDDNTAIEGASVAFNGETLTTDFAGMAVFASVSPTTNEAYTVTMEGYEEATGTVNVLGADLAVDVLLTPVAPANVAVTFNVNMGECAGESNVYLTGGFVDWAEPGKDGSILMADEDGDGTYTAIVEIAANTNDRYKYFVGEGWDGGDLTNGGCENGDRCLVLGADDVTFDDVFLCETAIGESLFNKVAIYPNPTNGILNIKFNGSHNNAMVKVYNAFGKLITSKELESDINSIDLNNMSSGLYLISIELDGKAYNQKFLLK